MPRRWRTGTVLLGLALLGATACGDSSSSASRLGVLDGPIPRVIAHRGGSDRAPQNTLVGFANGLALGTQILETDAHTTSDGVVVLLHDDTVDRTTDGTGRIHDLSLDEARGLDAAYHFSTDRGSTFPHRGTGVTIPTLDEVFERFPRERFLIEIKQTNPPMEEAMLDVIDRHDMGTQVCLASFIDTVVDRVRALAPEQCTSTSLTEVVELVLRPVEELEARGLPARATQFPFDVLGVPLVTRELVEKHEALGLEIHVWTVNEANDMHMLLELGVHGIITDRPDTLGQVITEWEAAR